LVAEGLLGASAAEHAARAFPRVTLRWSAAAAAVLAIAFGWSRMAGSNSGSPGPSTPLTGSTATEDATPRPVAATVPATPAGLRRLAPTERRLRDSAWIYGVPDDADLGWSTPGREAMREGSKDQPVRLELPIRTPPR